VIYAGIGSRETPHHILNFMSRYAHEAAARGDRLRTGGALGADEAFRAGCGTGPLELYLPWQGYNGLYADCPPITDAALWLAKRFHPAWGRCTQAAQMLHARNGFIVLGPGLKSPVGLVVCWTEGGRGEGGTGQALRIAKAWGVKVIDLGLWPALKCGDEAYAQVLKALDLPLVG
jgi:hypothetical protein